MAKTQKNIPNHVAIIPDGNRRWARSKNLKPWEGHAAGAKNLENLVIFALKKGIYCLSFWGSSLDNLKKRPLQEKKALLEIYKQYFQWLISSKEVRENEVRVNVIGRWQEQFPQSLKGLVDEVIEKTKNYNKRILNLLLAYSGTDEIIQAVQDINDEYGEKTKITAKVIKQHLMTKNIPAVDYVIRTGGEPHLSSGFMMWDIAEAQLYFSNLNFPDFNDKRFEEALEDYARRQRRFGK
jgi:undecaprenyl diphosphate synthase